MTTIPVDFIILKNKNTAEIIVALADYIEKCLLSDESVYIQCDDEKSAKQYDDDLWTFDPIRFVPHAIYDANAQNIPVQIGYGNIPERRTNCLINISQTIPKPLTHVSRMVEWVTPELQIKKREHYRWYQQHHYPLTHKEI